MCVGIPMRVIRCEGNYAICEGRNGEQQVDMLLVGEVQPGQWLLSFLGAARELLSDDDAEKINAALDGLEMALAGGSGFEAHFADLIGREPQLPDFLRGDKT